MIYIDDCLNATVKVMEEPKKNLSLRTYNVSAISFTPEELVAEMKNYFPKMEVNYVPEKMRQDIG